MTRAANPRPNPAETLEMLAIASERLKVDLKTGKLVWRRGFPESNRTLAGHEAGTRTCGEHRQVTIDCQRLQSGRIAFALANGRWPAGVVEYLDGNRSNLRPGNLRDSTLSHINLKRRQPAGQRMPKGVIRDGERFRVRVMMCGKAHWLGTFGSVREAADAYNTKAAELWSTDPLVGEA